MGSLPGTEPREAAALVTGELPDLPHLPELPGRGPGADMLGRAGSLLVDLHVDLQPSGWRLVDRAGMDERRARSYLGQDLDELESHADGFVGPVKLQVCGPWTRGGRAAAAAGRAGAQGPGGGPGPGGLAHRGPAARTSETCAPGSPAPSPCSSWTSRRCRRCSPARCAPPPGATTVAPVKETDAEDVLSALVAAVGVPVVVHCCAARPPVGLARRAGAAGVSVDLTLLGQDMDDELGEAVESGLVLLAGLVPSVAGGRGSMSGVAGYRRAGPAAVAAAGSRPAAARRPGGRHPHLRAGRGVAAACPRPP